MRERERERERPFNSLKLFYLYNKKKNAIVIINLPIKNFRTYIIMNVVISATYNNNKVLFQNFGVGFGFLTN